MKKGQVYFIHEGSKVTLTAESEGLELFIAVCNRCIFVNEPPVEPAQAKPNLVTVSPLVAAVDVNVLAG